MHTSRFAFASLVLLVAGVAATACTTVTSSAPSTGSLPPADSGASTSTAPGADSLGTKCTAACGGEAGKKCASAPAGGECANNLCLVDLAQPAGFLSYCTVDCGSAACPDTFHCEDITSFGDANVKRACVADAPTCGDGAKQLAEVCDGPSLAGYCEASCSKLTPPSVAAQLSFARLTKPASVATLVDSKIDKALPIVGDANGCGAVEVTASSAASIQTRWTLCYGTAVATLQATFPRDAAELSSLTLPLVGTLSIVDKPGAAPRILDAAPASTYFGDVQSGRELSVNAQLSFEEADGSGFAFGLLGRWTPPPAP